MRRVGRWALHTHSLGLFIKWPKISPFYAQLSKFSSVNPDFVQDMDTPCGIFSHGSLIWFIILSDLSQKKGCKQARLRKFDKVEQILDCHKQ